jgi:hypothetical protein
VALKSAPFNEPSKGPFSDDLKTLRHDAVKIRGFSLERLERLE